MNSQQQTGFPAGYCPPGSGVDNCLPDNSAMNTTRSLLYTTLIFLAMCLVSYLVSA